MAQEEKTEFKTSIGGQALIEGIMMRGPKKQAIVCRKADGELITKVDELKLVKDRHPILGWPIIRGSVNFLSSMVNGVKALSFSAECLPEEEQEEPSKFDKWIEEHLGSEKADKVIVGIAVLLGIALSVGLFILLPTLLAGFLDGLVKNRVLINLIEGVIRIVIFIAYMCLANQMKDIQRVWQYHGAEHKTIFCYEKGLELTVENVRPQPRKHPRCGTSFLFIVMVVSILVFALVRWSNPWIRMGLRLVLLPVVVGISYEIIRLAGRYDNVVTRIVSAPGKAFQALTTREPDDSMIEVAIEAMKIVIPEEKGIDKW